MRDEGAGPREPDDGPLASDAVTRGFFFSDLRGYTEFVEAHGAPAAAELLARYRRLMRAEIRRFGGAEIKTEGDSFYVVFDSVTTAVRCGLAVTSAARLAGTEHPAAPIRVGIGIHAGETVETAEGYVGSPVNIAARICSKAAAGEVLVSETVRALTRTLLPVEFQPRGRPRLKGVADTIALYGVVDKVKAVDVARQRGSIRPTRRATALAGGAVAATILLVGAASLLAKPGTGLPAGTWKVAVELPLTGFYGQHGGIPIRLAVQLAIDDVNATGGIGGARFELAPYDDVQAPFEGSDADRALANMRAMAADDRVIAVVGPNYSPVARAMIRVGNEAGLLICSPSTTEPGLTKAEYGAADLRSAAPDRNAFVRISPSDDIQVRALASFARRDLGVTRALVIDDGGNLEAADDFATEFTRLGGQMERRSLVYSAGAEPRDVLRAWTVASDVPDVVFWAGSTDSGGAALRVAMRLTGHGETPLVSWDGLWDGPGSAERSFIALAGSSAVGTYVSHASLPLAKAGFAERYRQAYGDLPDEYAAAGHACTEVILSALRAIAPGGVRADGLREAVRARVTDPANRYETVLGSVGFDGNGDALAQFVTFYRVEASADGGKGDWVITKQQDFGPAS